MDTVPVFLWDRIQAAPPTPELFIFERIGAVSTSIFLFIFEEFHLFSAFIIYYSLVPLSFDAQLSQRTAKQCWTQIRTKR